MNERRNPRYFMLALCVGLGCVAQNPAYTDVADGSGSSVGGDGSGPETGSTTTRDDATSAGSTATAPLSSTTSTANSSGKTATGTTEIEDTSDGTKVGRTDTDPTSGEVVVVLYAAAPVSGGFANGSSTVAKAGAERCGNADGLVELDLDCDSITPILASTLRPFSEIPIDMPELLSAELRTPDFEPAASSYEDLVAGQVDAGFANGATVHFGAPNDPSFWWGPASGDGPDCLEWSETEGMGRALTFDSAAGAPPLSSVSPCNQTRYILCACVTTF